jgi:hypothetical protein
MNPRRLLLEGELKRLTDMRFRDYSLACIEEFPKYFWTAPASGTGKFHPEDENTEGGLVTHTRRVIRMCEHLSVLHSLNYIEKDVLLTAALLHDSYAKGLNSHSKNTSTDPYHPLYVPQKFPYMGFSDKYIEEKEYDEIMLAVVSHSGRYSVTKSLNSDKKIPKILQVADYLASRRDITLTL